MNAENLPDYSVLMSVYHREKPAFLKASVESMLSQTHRPNQIVLVRDGPLTSELDALIEEFEYGGAIQSVRLNENVGLWHALNIGLQSCANEYVARMDTDDISKASRCMVQLKFMKDHELDLCSAWIEDFNENPGDLGVLRKLPEKHGDLINYAKKRNPINHMACMFKKSTVEKAGGYCNYPGFEDYELWVKIIMAGGRLGNYPGVLLDSRVGNGMSERRGGVSYCRAINKFYKHILSQGFLSRGEFTYQILIRNAISLLPSIVRASLYKKMLRDKS